MTDSRRKPDPQRMAFLRSLPIEVKQSITGEEAEQFMYGGDIPESLYDKIRPYILAPEGGEDDQ
jgi:hypothetical protein